MPMTETARQVLQESLAYEKKANDNIAVRIAQLHKEAEAELLRHYACKKRIAELEAALKD